MKIKQLSILIISLLLFSCSTGKKALQKGDYFSAVLKATERLKSDPDNKKAIRVIDEGYPLALKWSQEEMDMALSSNSQFKWEQAVNLMNQTNQLSDIIRSTPAARKIVQNPKSYTSELNMASEKAAEARYSAGIKLLERASRESAREAFDNFYRANQYYPGYKDVVLKLRISKEMATLKVVMEAIPVPSQRYQLSAEFFYNQVFEYINNQFGEKDFVRFYSPFQAEKEGLKKPDMLVDLEFFDFSIGNISRSEKEEKLERRVKVESKDTTRVQYKTYTAKLKTYIDQSVSGGTLRVRIYEPATNKLISDELIPGSFTWINEYAIFAGDVEALDKNQLELTRRKVLPLPARQDLFVEFTRPIYDQLTQKLNRFFRRYN
jgi:hypothetical protein